MLNCVKLVQKHEEKSVKNLCTKNVDKNNNLSFTPLRLVFSHIINSFAQQFYTWFLKIFYLKKRSLYTFYT